MRPTLLMAAFLIGLMTLPVHAQHGPTQADLNDAPANAVDWLLTNHDYGGQRFVDATEITRDNAGSLRAACVYQATDLRPFSTNPVVYRGVMYLTTAWSKVMAVDAATGEVLWRYDPHPRGAQGAEACCDVVNRGVAVWEGKVFAGTIDGRLVALDAANGKPIWESRVAYPQEQYTLTMAPRIAKGKVMIGASGSEFPVRGFVDAFDARSDRLSLIFFSNGAQVYDQMPASRGFDKATMLSHINSMTVSTPAINATTVLASANVQLVAVPAAPTQLRKTPRPSNSPSRRPDLSQNLPATRCDRAIPRARSMAIPSAASATGSANTGLIVRTRIPFRKQYA